MKRLSARRPSAGAVLGLLALIVALAGNADALTKHLLVRKGDIAKGAVTAKTLAKGAVGSKALAKSAVGAKAISSGAVTAPALGHDAVGASALAPGSVYGGALGAVSVHTAAIVDVDQVAENGTWTASSVVSASCSSGERAIGGGVVFTDPGNREVGVLTSVMSANEAANGYVGQITSNSGGTAKAEVQAVCLK